MLCNTVFYRTTIGSYFVQFYFKSDGLYSNIYTSCTDEQADKGYSQRNQEEMLRKYCLNQSIEIRDVIYEDHSAKTFNRPQWKNLITTLKKKKNNVNLILFTKWDRFSRNAGDAYQMINILRGLGVEPQAMETLICLSLKINDAGILSAAQKLK